MKMSLKLSKNHSQKSIVPTHAREFEKENKVESSQCRVYVIIKMTIFNKGILIYSKSYWYSRHELKRIVELHVENIV